MLNKQALENRNKLGLAQFGKTMSNNPSNEKPQPISSSIHALENLKNKLNEMRSKKHQLKEK